MSHFVFKTILVSLELVLFLKVMVCNKAVLVQQLKTFYYVIKQIPFLQLQLHNINSDTNLHMIYYCQQEHLSVKCIYTHICIRLYIDVKYTYPVSASFYFNTQRIFFSFCRCKPASISPKSEKSLKVISPGESILEKKM